MLQHVRGHLHLLFNRSKQTNRLQRVSIPKAKVLLPVVKLNVLDFTCIEAKGRALTRFSREVSNKFTLHGQHLSSAHLRITYDSDAETVSMRNLSQDIIEVQYCAHHCVRDKLTIHICVGNCVVSVHTASLTMAAEKGLLILKSNYCTAQQWLDVCADCCENEQVVQKAFARVPLHTPRPDVVSAVVHASMRHLHTESIQTAALHVLIWHCSSKSIAMLPGYDSYLYNAMDAHIHSYNIQRYACWVIADVAHELPDEKQTLIAGRGLEVCSRARAVCPEFAFLALAALGF